MSIAGHAVLLLWRLFLGSVALMVVQLSPARSAEFPFHLAWDARLPPVIESMAGSIRRPAGEEGYIQPQGDDIVFEANDAPARFWGIGLTFSGKRPWMFPPEKKDAARLVSKLRGLGFNHVRFVGFDGGAPEPLRAWNRSGKLDSETMDRFDYFVSELRKAGLYYSISINNSAILILDDVSGLTPNASAQTPLWRYKYIRLYQESAVSRLVSWYTAFYGHVNPYTKVSYARDPANIYISSANEDSIFEPFFRNFNILDKKHRKVLDQQFFGFLEAKHGSIERALLSWDAGGRPAVGGAEVYSRQHPPAVLGAGELKSVSPGRKRDTLEFLIEIDGYAAKRIKDALHGLGYRGLFSVTNNWYGYGALEANAQLGNYVDLHGYYDHPKRLKRPVRVETVAGRSLISGEIPLDSIDGEHSYPLSKAFRSASPSQPALFSEWGVGGWGDYGYEGPLLQVAYAAFQGYPLLDAHTYFNHPDPDPKDTLSRHALTVSGNGVLISLSPSLSLAFRRGDITTPEHAEVYSCAGSREEFLDKILEYGLQRTGERCGFYVNEGYVNKLRTELYRSTPEGSTPLTGRNYSGDEMLVSSTGQIKWWRGNGEGDGYFIVDAPRFMAVATSKDRSAVKASGTAFEFESHGAITMVSLDGKALRASESILITTVQSFRNHGMRRYDTNGRVHVVDSGQTPMMLKTADVRVRFRPSYSPDEMALCAVLPDGELRYLGAVAATGAGEIDIIVGTEETPWYWLGKGRDGECIGADDPR